MTAIRPNSDDGDRDANLHRPVATGPSSGRALDFPAIPSTPYFQQATAGGT